MMDRNVITTVQAAAINAERAQSARERNLARLYKFGLADKSPAGVRELTATEQYVDDLLGDDDVVQEKQTPDTWSARLVKLIPSEALSLYLALDRAVSSSPPGSDPNSVYWLTCALVFSVVFNLIYLRRVWRVQCVQIVVSTVALIAYVYVAGGVFEVIGWAFPKAQSFVLIATAAGLSLFPIPDRSNG